ncbi:hypothetical protein ACDY97_26945 [Rhizobium mongolense]|uniref:hypothetical protein n=1 Tax=Rhizobium mongolense TaxID=57676 RepID=UPI003558D958
MPVLQHNNQLLIVRISLSPSEVPFLLARHRQEYEDAVEIEQLGAQLLATDFPPDISLDFLERVHRWGKAYRNLTRVSQTGGVKIACTLRVARDLIAAGAVPDAVEEIRELPRIGLSFASKAARFLAPEKCVVLDSVIRGRLGYGETRDAYADFLQDCHQLLEMLKTSQELDSSLRAKLRVCDVEAAIFMKAKENKNVSP